MATKLLRAISILREEAARIVKVRLDRRPIDTLERLIEFNHMRAAYVAQSSLYGYLRTRMGSKYVALFQDDAYLVSLNKAKWATFASCLGDLTVFACALVHRDGHLERDATAALAVHCYRSAVEQTFDADIVEGVGVPAIEAFGSRAHLTDWRDAAQGENAFGRSPVDLVAFAPVIDEFKDLDSRIVTNSMRYRWRDVREQLRKRLSASELARSWTEAAAAAQLPPASSVSS